MKGFLGFLVGLAVLLAMVWAAMRGAIFLGHKLLELPAVVAAAAVAATVAPIGSVVSLAVGRRYERMKAVEQEIRTRKTAVYEGLLDLWSQMFMGEKMGRGITDAGGSLTHDFIAKTVDVNRGLVLWSNQEVLRRWSRLRRTSINNMETVTADKTAQYLVDLELLLRAVREDVGHSNKKLAHGDIVGLYINDIPVPPDEPPKKSKAKAALDALEKKEKA